jgi:catechol 2,3-dioxygenase-like lactoylglutathione lyase family enzyme
MPRTESRDTITGAPRQLAVTGLDHVTFECADVPAAVEFYRDVWGLRPEAAAPDGSFALSGPVGGGPRLIVRPADRDALAHVAFRCRAARSAAASDDAATAAHGVPCGEHPGAARTVLTDPDGRTVELLMTGEDAEAAGPGAPPLVEGHASAMGHAPVMGHVVLASPDVEANERFYVDRLGFRTTDRTARGMVFMRCNTDHHTLAIAQAGAPGVQHVAYDVGSIDQLMQNLARLRDLGVACVWGPGRHGPGHNVFAYYRDPLGCVVEQFADMEQVAADGPVEERWWGPDWPGDLWGLAGPPSREFLQSVLAVGASR